MHLLSKNASLDVFIAAMQHTLSTCLRCATNLGRKNAGGGCLHEELGVEM